MEEDLKLFTREEVKALNKRTEAFIIIHNYVYNVTPFLDEHPGGEEVLLEQAGKDATEAFEDVSHSSDARSLMKKYRVGKLVAAECVESANAYAPQWDNEQPQEQPNSWGGWLVPLLLAVAATLLYRYLFMQ